MEELKICPVKKVRLFASRNEQSHLNSRVLRRNSGIKIEVPKANGIDG